MCTAPAYVHLVSDTDQFEKLEKIHIGVKLVLNDLKPLRGEDAHGVADSVEASAAREHEESL